MTDPDPADFDAFYAASARRVLLALYALCGDLGDAEDILQEAYARAWQHWPKVSRYDNPEAWVYSVARRVVDLVLGESAVRLRSPTEVNEALAGMRTPSRPAEVCRDRTGR